MNTIALGIKLNDRHMIVGAQWPTKATLKAMARLKLARLKRKADRFIERLAMAIVPMPQCAAA
jgi:hypothetical protein